MNQAINCNDSVYCLARPDASLNMAMRGHGAAILYGSAVVLCPTHRTATNLYRCLMDAFSAFT